MADKKKKNKSKLSIAFTNDVIASKLYQDSINLRIRGAWRDAGDLLTKVAEVYIHTKMMIEAACFYTEAAEVYMHVDKGEAILAYQKSIKVYCDIGRFDIGGRLEQKVAYINLYAQHWEDAALHFRKAANFLSGDKLLDQSDHCIEKSAECLIQIGEFKEASHLYQMVAKSCVNSNLRRMNSLDHLLMSILCLMAVPEVVHSQPTVLKTPTKKKPPGNNRSPGTPRTDDASSVGAPPPLYQTKYESLYSMNEQFEVIDYHWRRSKEKLFVRNIIQARTDVDIHAYADHLYYWSNIRPINNCRTILLKVPMLEIKKIIDDAINAEAAKKLAEQAAAARRAKKKEREEHPSLASTSYRGSDTSSFQENRSSIGSDGKGPNLRDSITKDNTEYNARASIEHDGRTQGTTAMGRSSINSGGDGGRDSVSLGKK